ncbi:MAG: hypothetical protein K0S53_2131 [Bacteroidetes bacterium]|jgi:hypothetical protein|nr:hypothetical protein [Bacteroidota bacterium]
MKYFLLALTLFFSLFSNAQDNEKEKNKDKDKAKEDLKFIYQEATVETDDYNIYIIDAVSNIKQAKFKIKIFNKTNDYLLIKPTEFKYLAGGKTLLGHDKTYVISPNEEETEVIDFKGADMLAEKFTIEFKGIYKASAGGKVYSVPDFEVPATKNDFTVENFTCTLKKADVKTDKSSVKFECVYVGDGVGIINPMKASAIMPGGKENANSKKNQPMILEKGKKDDFTLIYEEVAGTGDMQKKGIVVKWNETLRESKLLPIGTAKLELIKESEKK